MLSNSNKTYVLQRKLNIFAALILTLFFLFSFSVVLADVDSADQNLVNQAYNRVLNQDQSTIKSHLGLYLEKYSSKDSEFVKRFKENAGLCNGLTILWLYSKWLDTQPRKNNGYDSTRFRSAIEAIATWDGKEKPQDEEANNFEEFASLIDFFQFPDVYHSGMPQNDLEDMISLSNLDTDGKTLKKVYAATEVFTKSQLCELLKNHVYDNELVYIKYNSHAVGLFKHEENYYYYDSNYSNGEAQIGSIEEIAEIIFTSNKYIDGKDFSIDIEVYSFDENPTPRPNQMGSATALTKSDSYTVAKGLLDSEYVGKYKYPIPSISYEKCIVNRDSREPYAITCGYDAGPFTTYYIQKYDVTGRYFLLDACKDGNVNAVRFLLANEAKIMPYPSVVKDCLMSLEDAVQVNKFIDESYKKLSEVFVDDPEKLKGFHGSAYADIAERAIEKFEQAATAMRNIASVSVGAYLDFQDNLYNQFLQLAESEIGKEAGRRAVDVLWDMVDTVQIAAAEPEVVRSFVKGFTTCEGGCIIIGGTIGAVGGTAVSPGAGTVGGALAGGFSGATLCLPGCFCVGLTNAGLKAIDIKNKFWQ